MTHEERSEHARNIQQSVGRMTGMMEDFLTHDKVQAGKLQCHPAWMELAVFCQELIAEVVSTLDAGRHVECTIDPAAQRVFLDRKILRHIISNLLSNAVKYSTADQSVFIEVERTQPGSQKAGEPVPPPGEFLQFKVRDTGIGIPAEDLTRLYQTFHRAANVGNRPGTGMGLAIVKQFVDLHGGTIRVESREGKGSSFWVWLPIAAPRAQDNSGPTVPAVAKSSEP
jgi:signal transduction histidine kinase